MEYIYAAMLLHSADKQIDAAGVESVLKAAGVKPVKARAEALVASLEGVDIAEAMATALAAPAAGTPAPAAGDSAPAAEAEAEEEEEEEVSEEEAVSGLGALFG